MKSTVQVQGLNGQVVVNNIEANREDKIILKTAG
jgi:hypothetical protein